MTDFLQEAGLAEFRCTAETINISKVRCRFSGTESEAAGYNFQDFFSLTQSGALRRPSV